MTDKENNKLDRVFSIISLLDNNLANLITEAPGLTIYLDELKANEFQLKKLFGSAFSDITFCSILVKSSSNCIATIFANSVS